MEWRQIGADIVKRAFSYPLKLIAKNAGVNGSVVIEKVRLDSTAFVPCSKLIVLELVSELCSIDMRFFV